MGRKRAALLVVSSIVGGTLAIDGTAGAGPVTVVTSSHTITVTKADNGHHYRLHAGDHLDVRLSGPSKVTWSEPTTSNRAVLRRTAGTSSKTATGTFITRAEGKAQVTAVGMINCHSPCPGPIMLFQIKVSVVS